MRNISVDADGNLWVENVSSAPGVINLGRTGISLNSLVVSSGGAGVDYLAFGNGFAGIDMPLQYTSNWIDRVTQVGPGLAPSFTPVTASSTNYPIVNITQPPASSDDYGNPFYGYIYFLQSGGPGSTAPGNVVTIYYGDSTAGGTGAQNADLVAAFNSGQPVYIYLTISGTPTSFGPLVVQVTAVGEASPPGQPRDFYYFTFNVTSSAFTYYQGSGHPSYEATWQRTLATLTTTVPVPNLTVGGLITVAGNSVSSWNAQWRVTQTPNASQMAITGSQVTSGVATLNYAVTGGTNPPVAGQLVTITNTLNAGGQLNVSNATIAFVFWWIDRKFHHQCQHRGLRIFG